MDEVKFAFFVMPGVFCFVAFVFVTIFSPEIYHWYVNGLAAQKIHKQRYAPAKVVEPRQEVAYSKPSSKKRELEHAVH